GRKPSREAMSATDACASFSSRPAAMSVLTSATSRSTSMAAARPLRVASDSWCIVTLTGPARRGSASGNDVVIVLRVSWSFGVEHDDGGVGADGEGATELL